MKNVSCFSVSWIRDDRLDLVLHDGRRINMVSTRRSRDTSNGGKEAGKSTEGTKTVVTRNKVNDTFPVSYFCEIFSIIPS